MRNNRLDFGSDREILFGIGIQMQDFCFGMPVITYSTSTLYLATFTSPGGVSTNLTLCFYLLF